jgi:processive 1,2-diacylglycerol beta-glucosyltransferase
MINLYEKDTNKPLGQISEAQLQYLIDHLEEEGSEDQDYAVTPLLLEYFEGLGADPSLISLLKDALGGREEIEIVWSK